MAWSEGESGNPKGRPTHVKPWKEAIVRAIKRREDDDPKALDKLADQLLAKVAEGDVSAIKELGDRLDGKVAQAIIGGTDDDPPIRISRIELVAVKPNDGSTG